MPVAPPSMSTSGRSSRSTLLPAVVARDRRRPVRAASTSSTDRVQLVDRDLVGCRPPAPHARSRARAGRRARPRTRRASASAGHPALRERQRAAPGAAGIAAARAASGTQIAPPPRLVGQPEQRGVQVGLAVERPRHGCRRRRPALPVLGRVLADHVDGGRLDLDQKRAGRTTSARASASRSAGRSTASRTTAVTSASSSLGQPSRPARRGRGREEGHRPAPSGSAGVGRSVTATVGSPRRTASTASRVSSQRWLAHRDHDHVATQHPKRAQPAVSAAAGRRPT